MVLHMLHRIQHTTMILTKNKGKKVRVRIRESIYEGTIQKVYNDTLVLGKEDSSPYLIPLDKIDCIEIENPTLP